MPVQRRSSKESNKELSPVKSQGVHKGGAGNKAEQRQAAPAAGAGGSLLRTALAVAALALALGSAMCEWPMYMVYEKDFRRPAVAFTLNLGITAIISLAISASPQVRLLKAAPAATAADAGGAAPVLSPAVKVAMRKQAIRKLLGGIAIILAALYFGFGLYGPSGALTAAGLSTFLFLVLP